MKKVLVYLYNILFLRISSLFINLYIYLKYSKEERLKAKKDTKFILKNIDNGDVTAENVFSIFNYVSDPVINKKFTMNFIPFFIIFLLQKGSDCSGGARIFKMLKEREILNKNGKLYLIMDKFNIATSHVFYMWYDKGYFNVFNSFEVQSFTTKEECFFYIKNSKYIGNDGIEFDFQNGTIYRWF